MHFQKSLKCVLILLICCNYFSSAQESVLTSKFTDKTILVDGIPDAAWKTAPAIMVHKAMTPDISRPMDGVMTKAEVRSLWDGAMLYLFIKVKDTTPSNSSKKFSDQDGIEVYLDVWNDKYPKYEEDDALWMINTKNESQTRGTILDRFAKSAMHPDYDSLGHSMGYTAELAIHLGGISQQNGTRIGLEIGINDAENNILKQKIFWSNGYNTGLNDNSEWGTVLLNGYQKSLVKKTDHYSLNAAIKKAESLPLGIWLDETKLIQFLAEAKKDTGAINQNQVNLSTSNLNLAIKNLRRNGEWPDPMDLPETNYLPDPFSLIHGQKIVVPAEYHKKTEEVKSLVQYYEYGTMPAKPETLTATLDGKILKIKIRDRGKRAEFEAQLTVPDIHPDSNEHIAFPVLLSIDFFSREANPLYLKAGYAVLSMRYTALASDNFEHKGAFYDLYPYELSTGHDGGTLLAWAWGAMRCVDALEYLNKNNDVKVQSLDLQKIIVTGFSRCGKAALVAGLFDDRFGLVSPGASGCGGAAVYRYVSMGNRPFRKPPYGNTYPWGTSSGCEVLGDKIRHQGHNSNFMLSRFLNYDRIYQTNSNGYGQRLPYDHHEIIAAIAPRAVLITTATDDYANNAEGDAIAYEAARPVYDFMGIKQNIGLNIRTSGEVNPRGFGGGHWISDRQISNLISFANMVFYKKSMDEKSSTEIYTNPYLTTMDQYYGGIKTMMPWLEKK